MNKVKKISLILIVFGVATFSILLFAVNSKIITEPEIYNKSAPKSIRLNFDEIIFQKIVNNPDNTKIEVTQIIQEPSRYVEKYTKPETEAILVTLKGKGEVRILEGKYNNKDLTMSSSEITYIPPGTNFTIFNTAKSGNLKYLIMKFDLC